MPSHEDFIKSQLALEAWREGHKYGGTKASLMIAWTIANRVRRGWGDWMQVLGQIPMFKANNEQDLSMPDRYDPAWLKILAETDKIYAGIGENKASGANGTVLAVHWADLAGALNPRFQEEIVSKRNRVVQMGTLTLWD